MQLEKVSEDATILCVRIVGDVTQNAYGPSDEPLADNLGRDLYQRAVLLDLSACPFIDSRGVGWLLKCHKLFRAAGGVLVLHSMTVEVGQVLKVLRMDLVMDLATDESSARAKATSTTSA